jgi:hypothetical protein
MFTKIKKWLDRMAEKNEKLYGSRKLDCCGMNRNSMHGGIKRPAAKGHVHTTS